MAVLRPAFLPVLFVALLEPLAASAQTITGLTMTANGSGCADSLQTGDPRTQRLTSADILASEPGSFRTRFAAVAAADDEGTAAAQITCQVDYTIEFAVTAPAAYVLEIDTALRGALTLVDDGGGVAGADIGSVVGTYDGGTLVRGTLDLTDPGDLMSAGGGNHGFARISNRFSLPRIQGRSDGVPRTHTLTFRFEMSCSSDPDGNGAGDECAVRLGERASFVRESASDYPGPDARHVEEDGHIVSVTLLPAPDNDECTAPRMVTTTPFFEALDTRGATGNAADPLQTCSGAPQSSPRQNSNTVWYAMTAPGDGEIIVDTQGSDYDTVLTGNRGTCGSLTQQGCSDDDQIGERTSRIDIVVSKGTTYLFDVSDYASPAGGELHISIVYDADCGNGYDDDGEQCDDGAANGTPGSTCTADCTVRPPLGVCGNGTVDGGEQCDQGSENGNAGSCCTAECTVRPAVTPCRASAGPCDPAEVCDGASGVCPADAKSTSVCRKAAGACDVAEVCDGAGNACPANARAMPGAVCRAATEACDLPEVCSGLGDSCPADSFAAAGTPCRADGGTCDVAESCTGSDARCPADAKLAISCRASAGVCDQEDFCDGVGDECPADEKRMHVCRASAGACDIEESCDGSGNECPVDAKSTQVCRPADGACDVAESCDGTAEACPADAVAPAGTPCRGAGTCDVAETCTGSTRQCPADGLADDGAPCDDGDRCTGDDVCTSGQCSGSSVCGNGDLDGGCAEECDDGNARDGDGCSSICTLEPCAASPVESCALPFGAGKSRLTLTSAQAGSGAKLSWKWSAGQAIAVEDLGDPASSTAYALCIYDAAEALVSTALAPAGGTCGGVDCWRMSASTLRYYDRELTPGGLRKLTLKAGEDAQARMVVSGEGDNLALPDLPVNAFPLTVQLQSSDGPCWEAVFGWARRNDSVRLQAVSD
ncbi:MAG TPA: hypothetical protein VEC57_06185 [Candidatus Limnocylindrales bacterium]|nr:hypothetical protein [Candidatus Limnocylindrales bacterium]